MSNLCNVKVEGLSYDCTMDPRYTKINICRKHQNIEITQSSGKNIKTVIFNKNIQYRRKTKMRCQ